MKTVCIIAIWDESWKNKENKNKSKYKYSKDENGLHRDISRDIIII